jgi:hypothetical protein
MTNEFLKKATLFLVDVFESIATNFLDTLRNNELLLSVVLAREKESNLFPFNRLSFYRGLPGDCLFW